MFKTKRNCLVCGENITIKVGIKGHYDNGHYFGEIRVPIKETGEWKQIGTSKILNIGGKPVPVVKWTGKEKKLEYWECNLCFDAAAREGWLEEKIEGYYGKRCPDFEPNCHCCKAWGLYDKIVKCNYLRGIFKQEYNKEANASYIYVKQRIAPGEAVKQLELSDYIILDFNKKDRLLGIEVLNASKAMPKVFEMQKGRAK
jgi:uncharacterized protein YuzE